MISEVDVQLSQGMDFARKTVVQVDLAGFSKLLSIMDQGFGAGMAAELNRHVQLFIDESIRAQGLRPETVVHQRTGDGAILLLEEALTACLFAVSLHKACAFHNGGRTEALSKRYFRVGIATGELYQDGKGAIAGEVIARAARLESHAPLGGVLIDLPTHALLPEKEGKVFENSKPFRTKPLDQLTQARFTRCIPESEIDRWRQAVGISPLHGGTAAKAEGRRPPSRTGNVHVSSVGQGSVIRITNTTTIS